MEELLRILEKNARMPIEDIAAMLDKTPEEVAAMMDEEMCIRDRVWMLHTKWQGKDYLFAMNGQTGKLVGDLPVDKRKVAAWFAGISVPPVSYTHLRIRHQTDTAHEKIRILYSTVRQRPEYGI